MKNSNKILLGVFISLSLYVIGGKIAERMAFSNRQKIEFEPGLTEKNIAPFKIIVIKTQLEPNSTLSVEKGARFALAADPNFWKVADFSQRGDTLFVQQKGQKMGKLSDPTNQESNDYAEIRVLCPSGLTTIWSDISVSLENISADSLQINVEPNREKTFFAGNKCTVRLKKCQSKTLKITANRNTNIKLDDATQLENLALMLKDSTEATVNSFVGQQILVDCAAKANVSLSGANLAKLKKM